MLSPHPASPSALMAFPFWAFFPISMFLWRLKFRWELYLKLAVFSSSLTSMNFNVSGSDLWLLVPINPSISWFKNHYTVFRNSLVVQQLRLHASTTGVVDSTPGWGKRDATCHTVLPKIIKIYFKKNPGTSLVAQRLGLCFQCKGSGFGPWSRSWSPHATTKSLHAITKTWCAK